MKKMIVILSIFVMCFSVAACSPQPDVEALQNEIDSLKRELEQLKNDLAYEIDISKGWQVLDSEYAYTTEQFVKQATDTQNGLYKPFDYNNSRNGTFYAGIDRYYKITGVVNVISKLYDAAGNDPYYPNTNKMVISFEYLFEKNTIDEYGNSLLDCVLTFSIPTPYSDDPTKNYKISKGDTVTIVAKLSSMETRNIENVVSFTQRFTYGTIISN